MSDKFQRLRFEKNFPEAALSYDETKKAYTDEKTQLLFQGWLKAVEAEKTDKVEMYFSRTYGWCLQGNDGHDLDHPELETEVQALLWAYQKGLYVTRSEE